ncbi:MAG TPA: hypothetical protein VMF03_10925 [Steroidobacteraceae bacterium]|nr:hypothetical protein [Steroidobacteraceae bacterium]
MTRARWVARALFGGLMLAAGILRAQAIYTPPPGQNFEGVWLIQGDHSTVRTVDGKLPPLNGAAARRYAAALQARRAGKPDFDTIRTCRPHGFPRILFAAYPIEILQERTQVTFIHEVHHMPRLVYLDMTLPDLGDMDPNWMGLSVGHWEGDTLVVESQGFNDLTTLDSAGLPHSQDLRVGERIRKTDADTLEDVITITDPKTFTAPWSTRVTYRRQPGLRLKEYVCTDSNPEAQASGHR